ncbi:MAG: sigma-70 family RNA polymerase sigma factor [Caldilineaceae bacterium]
MSTQSESELIERAKRDPEAFAQLYDTYVDRIYLFVRRRALEESVAEDITALTFEKALRALPAYQSKGAGFCAWLYRIARNELVSHLRRQRRFTFLHPNQASPLNLDWLVEHNEELAELRTALGKLSATDQELLGLRFFEELSNAEIAEVLGCAVDNVYVRLHRALKRLAQHFATLHTVAAGERIHVLE